MEIISEKGRTSAVYRVKEGLVCKSPQIGGDEEYRADIANQFAVEKLLLQRLGDHPRIVRYHGPYTIEGMEEGLLLSEAKHGDLQSYIDEHDSGEIDNDLRRKWCLQLAEAVAYVHEKGIIHSNISTTNVLVYQTGQTKDLLLADFGGSNCYDLGLDGYMLPDELFFDLWLKDLKSLKVDLFSLGIILYIINTGHYPFYTRPAPQERERFAYEDRVNALFDRGEFSDLSGVLFGDVIAGCCCERRFETAKEVVEALEAEMSYHASWRSKLVEGVFAQHSTRITVFGCVVFLIWIIWYYDERSSGWENQQLPVHSPNVPLHWM